MKLKKLKIKPCPKCGNINVYAVKTCDEKTGIICSGGCGHELFSGNPVDAKRQWNAESKRHKILFRKF